ncbi:MAG: ArsR family transcriptional regulator [Phycisphaerales bacterium]|nr:MAG: ArsR family transcriptional regulator [Phycisphaerales bacterium]
MSRPINGRDVFRAISHPARRKIIELLQARERTVGDLAAAFKFSLATLSAHLRVLREAGLISQQRQANTRRYRLRRARLREIRLWTERVGSTSTPR